MFAKNADFKTETINGLPVKVDFHGLSWSERSILKIENIDIKNNIAIVINCNDLKWPMLLSNLEFCDKNGKKL